MRIPSLLSLVGFILIITATYCPMLRPLGLFNMNVYSMNKPYGIVILLVAVIGIIGTVLNQVKVARAAAWTSLVLAVLLYVAAVMKANTSFSFIPFHGIASYLASKIKFKWGWYVLFAGVVLALCSLFGRKKAEFTNKGIE